MVTIPGDAPVRRPGTGGAYLRTTATGGSIPKSPANSTTPSGQRSAFTELQRLFDTYGLGSLAPVIVRMQTEGLGTDEAYLQLQETKEWKQRFSGNEILRQKGKPVLTPDEYLAKESALRRLMGPSGYDLPKGFYDTPDDFAKAIGAELGEGELRRRLDARKALVTDGAMTGALQYARDKYGLSEGDLVAYFIDPDRAAPLLEKIAGASQVGAAAARARWGDLSRTEAEKLADLGVSADQAQAGFGQAADMLALTESLDGDRGVDRSDLLGATFGDDAEAKRRVTRKREERAGRFQGGGGYAEGRTGITGLGSATTR